MGNTQSTVRSANYPKGARRSHRLSKPRTGQPANTFRDIEDLINSSLLSPCSLSSPYSPGSPWPDSHPRHFQRATAPVDGILCAEPSSPHSPDHSRGSGSQGAGDDGKTRSNFGEIMGELKRRLSQSGSRSRGSRFSYPPELEQVDIRLSQKIPVAANRVKSEETKAPFGLGVGAQDEFQPAENHRFSLIRRLSLYNTNKSSKSPKTLLQTIFCPRNTEQGVPSFSYWGPDGHLPLRRDSADTVFLYEMTRSAPLRASTPSDLEYSHLGRLKLGSLRVVNGSASPAPSDRVPMSVRRQSFSDMKSIHLDLRNSVDLLQTRSRDWGDGYSTSNLQETYSHSSHLESSPNRSRTPQNGPGKSPLRPEHGIYAPTPSNNNDLGLPVFRLSWPGNPDAFLGISSTASSKHDLSMQPNASASPSLELSQVLQTTSKANEFDDNLFEDEGVEILGTGKDESIEHEDNDECNRGRPIESSTRGSPVTMRGRKVYPLTKADSGYSTASSNRSLRLHKMSLTKRSDGEEIIRTTNAETSRATKVIEECNESITSPCSSRRSLSESPPPVPRKDTPPHLKSPNVDQHCQIHGEFARTQPPNVRSNASFSQRMSHIITTYDGPKTTRVDSHASSPSPVFLGEGFRSFLSDTTAELGQTSWPCKPDFLQYDPFESFEPNPFGNHVNRSTAPIRRSTSVQTKMPSKMAHIASRAHHLHHPQSMSNLNKVACAPTSNWDPDHYMCKQQQEQEQEQRQNERNRSMRGSFFRSLSKSKKQSTAVSDRTSIFGYRRMSKPNNPTLAQDTSSTTATATGSTILSPSPRTAEKGDFSLEAQDLMVSDEPSSPRQRPGAYYNSRRTNSRISSTFTAPFPAVPGPQESKTVVKPSRSFVRGAEGRKDSIFCVGFSQSQSQAQTLAGFQ
ncbi:hypothetical protein GX48_06534 [Paracoccidioides brasiliensis]|nr:hypothetical protein GX48_06534 [Paracoccidioides brasiliensis]